LPPVAETPEVRVWAKNRSFTYVNIFDPVRAFRLTTYGGRLGG
jgi:hypothetical protein